MYRLVKIAKKSRNQRITMSKSHTEKGLRYSTILCYSMTIKEFSTIRRFLLQCCIVNFIQSFAYIWLHKGNQNEFLKHPKIKWLDGGLEPPTSGLPVHCSTT